MDSPAALVLLLAIPVLALVPALVARAKDRDFLTWYVYAVFFFPIALIHSLVFDRVAHIAEQKAESRLFDVAPVLVLVASGAAFYLGADAITTHKDINAIYFVVVGVVLVRGASNLARADRASG